MKSETCTQFFVYTRYTFPYTSLKIHFNSKDSDENSTETTSYKKKF